MIILLAAPYLFFAAVITISKVTAKSNGDAGLWWVVAFAALLLVYIANDVYAFILQKLGYTARKLFFWSMLLKLCYIPFYVAIFFLGCILAMTGKGIIVVPFLMIFDYLLLLPSTFYGFSGITKAAKNPMFGKIGLVVCGVLEFFFLADIVCAVYLYCRSRCVPEPDEMQYAQYQYVPYQEVPVYQGAGSGGGSSADTNENEQ